MTKGFLALLLLGAAFALYGCDGGGSKESIELDEQGFRRAQAGLEATIRLTKGGMVTDAQEAFKRLRPFFRKLDAPLRAKDLAVGAQLAEQAGTTEKEFTRVLKGEVRDTQALVFGGERLLGLLGQAATAFGYSLPPSSLPTPAPSPTPRASPSPTPQ